MAKRANSPRRPPDRAVARLAVETATAARVLFPRRHGSGLEPNAAQVLLALYADPGRTVIELSAALVLAKTTVSHAVTELQQRGLVTETEDRDDRRRRLQRPTAAGTAAAADLVASMRSRWPGADERGSAASRR